MRIKLSRHYALIAVNLDKLLFDCESNFAHVAVFGEIYSTVKAIFKINRKCSIYIKFYEFDTLRTIKSDDN